MPNSVLKRLRSKINKMSDKRTAAVDGQAVDEDRILKEIIENNRAGDDDGEILNEVEMQADVAPQSHRYPQVCSECHHAWVEKRFGEVGTHQKARVRGAKDEDCVLWDVISSNPGNRDGVEVSVVVEDTHIAPQAASAKTSSTVDDESITARVSDHADGFADTEKETYDLNGVMFYTSSDEPREVTREIRIIPESQIHLPLVEYWLRNCQTEHLDCSRPRFAGTADSKAKFHLIDVFSQKIVLGALSSSFVALSYVWGGAEQLQLTKALYPELTQHQGLLKHQDKIPTTIRDAMTVVSSIGERYLWVDYLCIIQDDMADKKAQIDQMAAIYDAAMLTIVACTATNANDFLPGVQPGKRTTKNEIARQNGILFVKEEKNMLAWTLHRVSHSARAWTFQEVILSRRCLYFLDGEVMLQCQKSLFKESTTKVSSHGMMNQVGNWPPLTESFMGQFFRYREIVHSYSCRKLSFPKDRKDAFTGVTKALESAWGWKFCYCMPASYDFNSALLWTGEYSVDTAKQWEEKQWEMARSSGFPTWSWLSASGRAWYLNEKESVGHLQPLIDWQNTTVWDGVRTYNFLEDPMKSNGMEAQVKGYPPGTMIIIDWVKHVTHETQFGAKLSDSVREEIDKQASYGSPCAPMVDGNGNWCGTLNGLTQEQFLELLAEEEAELSLILLSATQKTWVLGGFRKSPPPFDVEQFESGEFKTVNVMLVKWNERLATRVAVGELHVDAWKDNCPEPEGDIIRLV